MKPLSATARLQFHKDFTLDRAAGQRHQGIRLDHENV